MINPKKLKLLGAKDDNTLVYIYSESFSEETTSVQEKARIAHRLPPDFDYEEFCSTANDCYLLFAGVTDSALFLITPRDAFTKEDAKMLLPHFGFDMNRPVETHSYKLVRQYVQYKE